MGKGNPPVATGKASQFAADAEESGWSVEYFNRPSESREEVVAKTGGKTDKAMLILIWDKNRYNYDESRYEIDGHTRTVRNASEARRILSGELKPQPGKATNRQFVRKKAKPDNEVKTKQPAPEPFKSKPKPPTILPFDPETASDKEILDAVRGKKITWKNRLSGNFEVARVLSFPKQNHLRIEINSRSERCLTFAEADLSDPRVPEGGFRAIRIKSIVSVTK